MATRLSKAEKKIAYDARLCKLLEEYSQILIVAADNVGSNQLQHIRAGLRDHSIVLMGKNTMMKRSIRLHAERTGNRDLLNLIPLLQVIWWSFIWSAYSIIVFFLLSDFRGFFSPSFSYFGWIRAMWVWFSLKVIWRKWATRWANTRWQLLLA